MISTDYAKQKVQSMIDTIDSVKELDFPYEHPLDAVNFIRSLFEERLYHLNSISNAKAARSMCRRASENIDNLLLAIGFMVRACDIRGPLELQGPLLRLTRQAIGSHVKLVLFSEWRFSPFTELYPGDFGDKFVLVGLPVPEGGNPLIASLAGHELGHNIWRCLPKALIEIIGKEVKNKVTETIKGQLWERFVKAFKLSKKQELDQDELFDTIYPWRAAETWGISHCEEMFCDCIGLCIFGEGYLHAFQYLLSPGGGLRNPGYPSVRNRIGALLQASETLGLSVPKTFNEEFDETDVSSDPKQQLLLEVSDEASHNLVPVLIEIAKQWCANKGIISRDTNEVTRICESFKKVVPATGAKSLADIINAAWKIFLDNENCWARDYPITERPEKRIELLRELALKSFEVYEIEKIQEESNAPVSR
jgi:hypothetical protein